MAKQETISAHKLVSGPENGTLLLYGAVLTLDGRVPNYLLGEGCLEIQDGLITGNVRHNLWSPKAVGVETTTGRSASDFIPWHLQPKGMESIPATIHPDEISIGPEDECSLITPDSDTFGSSLLLPPDGNVAAGSSHLTPELKLNAVEITGPAGGIIGGYDQILSSLHSSRKSLV